MKRSLLIVMLVMIIWSTTVYAEDIQSGFIITGPSELAIGETGEFIVNATIKDAAGVQATLSIDDTIFELVNGELTGVWDAESNQDITVELIKVELRAKESTDTNIETLLCLVEYKMARLTKAVPPVEDVIIEGANYSVKVKSADSEIVDKNSNNVSDVKVVNNPNSNVLNSIKTNNDAQSRINVENRAFLFIIIIALLVLLSVLIVMLIRKNRTKR